MVQKGFYILVFLFIYNSSFLMSQTDDEYAIPFDSLSIKDKLHYNFQMGVTVTSDGSFGTFYRPSLVYQISPKISVSTGVMYQNIHANNLPVLNDFQYQTFSGNISQYYAFVAGKYQVNDQWAVGGSVFYNNTQLSDIYGANLNQHSSGFDRLGYSGFIQYKSESGFTITGEIRVNDRFNANNRYGTGFNSSFGTGFDGDFGSPFRSW